MDWSAAASIAEIIGAIAVVIPLIYLATEVRSNTGALKARAGFDASLHMSELNEIFRPEFVAAISAANKARVKIPGGRK